MPLGCEYSLSKDGDDNANSFDAIAFFLCALQTGTTLIVNHIAMDQGEMCLQRLHQQQPITTQKEKKNERKTDELKMCIFIVSLL